MTREIMEHVLTPKQQECVDYRGKNLLIRGIPGSGKTVVVLRRARKLAEETTGDGIKVRVFTFNETLAKYARELVRNLDNPKIEVIHFHSWAYRALKKLGRRPQHINEDEIKNLVKEILEEKKRQKNAKILERDLEFWLDEIKWIKGSLIQDLPTYESVERRGRGSALRVADRRIVWDVYQSYQAALQEMGKMDWEDFALELIKIIETNDSALPEGIQCDHVLVDEAQDLHASQLRLLRMVARESLTIAADESQKIYNTSFSWKDLGINIVGSGSKRLTTSFRSTRQIIRLAMSLRKHDPAVKLGTGDVVEYELPDIDGTTPKLYATDNNRQEEVVVLHLIRDLINKKPESTIGLLCRQWRPLRRYSYLLKENKIPYEFIEKDKGVVTTPGVKLTTFHSAKGLEFDFVVLVRLNEGVIPPKLTSDLSAKEMEEFLAFERRLLYVSMTRAKFGLYMTYSSDPSRFIDELDPDLYVRSSIKDLT